MATLAQMLSDMSLMGMANLNSADMTLLLNKCQREEVEAWDWSFLQTNVIINAVTPITTGTVSVTQGSSTIVGVGTSFPATAVNWWFRAGATLTTPVLATFVSATQLTLSTPWGAPTLTNAGFSLFPLYYDVSPLIEVQNVKQVDFLEQVSQEALNRIDPSRLSTGGSPSLRWANAPWNAPTTTGHFQIELWPVPAGALPYIVWGKMGSIDLALNTDNPLVPSAVLENKAMMYAAQSLFASNSNPKWLQLAQSYQATYMKELQDARTADDRRKVTLGISASGSRGGVNSGIDYLYNHDPAGPPYIGGNGG
jgi:hypothetical protein